VKFLLIQPFLRNPERLFSCSLEKGCFFLWCRDKEESLQKRNPCRAAFKEKQAKPHPLLLKICSKVKLMKMFFAKSDRLEEPSPAGFIQILK